MRQFSMVVVLVAGLPLASALAAEPKAGQKRAPIQAGEPAVQGHPSDVKPVAPVKLAWKKIPQTYAKTSGEQQTIFVPMCRPHEFEVETTGGLGLIDLRIGKVGYYFSEGVSYTGGFDYDFDDHANGWEVQRLGGAGQLGGPSVEDIIAGAPTISPGPGQTAANTRFRVRLTKPENPPLVGDGSFGPGLYLKGGGGGRSHGRVDLVASDSAGNRLEGKVHYKYSPIGTDFLKTGVSKISSDDVGGSAAAKRRSHSVFFSVAYAYCRSTLPNEALSLTVTFPSGEKKHFSMTKRADFQTTETGTFRYQFRFAGKTASPEKTFEL